MPAQFFLATDDKPTGTTNAYQAWMTFARQNGIELTITNTASRAEIQAAIDEMWDGLGGNLASITQNLSPGTVRTNATELEIAVMAMFCLNQKFRQYGATLPGGG